MSRKTDQALLADLVIHASRVAELVGSAISVQSIKNNQDTYDAILWNLLVVGEVCGRFDDSFRQSHADIPWQEIRGFRNVLAHGYDIIDWRILEPILTTYLPNLLKQAQSILDTYGPPPTD